MTIKSLQSTSLTNNIFYRSMLAGNDAFFPEFESDEFLEEVVLTSSASSVTFTGLASYATAGYKHLQIRMVARSDRGSTQSDMAAQLNGDTGSNYAFHRIVGASGSVQTGQVSSYGNMRLGVTSAASNSSGAFSAYLCDVLDFSSSSKNTTLRTLEGSAGSGYQEVGFYSGLWNSTSSVTSIRIFDEANFVAGSRFSLYGSKA
jgi:hypothetical protein